MSESTNESEAQTRAKIQNLISLYEKSTPSKSTKQKIVSSKLSTRISDFAWPEKEVSDTPKHATEIAISDYVSVRNLISVYQEISQQGTSPIVGRKDSYSKRKKTVTSLDQSSDRDMYKQISQPVSNLYTLSDTQYKKELESPCSTVSDVSTDNKIKFSATSGLFDDLSLDDEESSKSNVHVLSTLRDKKYDELQLQEESEHHIGFAYLPESYSAVRLDNGTLILCLPSPMGKSNFKAKSKLKKKKQVDFKETPTLFIETYNVYEYERGDESLDPVASSAQYEIEKKTEKLEKFTVILVKGGKGLGLSIVGIGLGSETGEERLGIYIKALTSGGVAETEGSLMVQDQILEVDGVSLVGVSQKFAGETLKATGQNVKFLIGREKVEEN